MSATKIRVTMQTINALDVDNIESSSLRLQVSSCFLSDLQFNSNKTLYTFTMCATAMLFGCAPADQDGAMELSTVKTDDELSAKIELLFDKYIQNEWDVMDVYQDQQRRILWSGQPHGRIQNAPRCAVQQHRHHSIRMERNVLDSGMAKRLGTATPLFLDASTGNALLNYCYGAKMFRTQKQLCAERERILARHKNQKIKSEEPQAILFLWGKNSPRHHGGTVVAGLQCYEQLPC